MNGTNSTGDATGPARVGWVPPPNAGRSTWGIIWSCLAVFLLCSWKCTHLNIPSVEESEAGWHKLSCIPIFPEKPLRRKWRRKLMFMGLIAIAPEVVVALAAYQYMEARQALRVVNRLRLIRRKYTMAHAMFAQMGGFVVHYYDDSTTQEAEVEPKSQKRDADADAEIQVANEAIDTRFEASMLSATRIGDGNPSMVHLLDLSEVARLEKYGIPFNLAEADIKDRSKADPLTKAFALLQAGWLVLQSCARKGAGLQITELELMTMAFTVCALATYVLWWHKPFDAERSAIVSLPMSHRFAIQKLLRLPHSRDMSLTEFRQTRHKIDFDRNKLGVIGDISDGPGPSKSDLISSLTFCIFGAIFSSIHFAAWKWGFPQPIVQTLWQSFCCAALGSAILPTGVAFLFIGLLPHGNWTSWAGRTFIYAFIVINIVSRLALIGITFYCFTSMPESTYQDLDWTLFLPHFS